DLISTHNRVFFCGACEKTIGSTELEENLVFISDHYSFLPTAITSLEAVGSPKGITCRFRKKKKKKKKTISNLNSVPGSISQKVKEKINYITSKNPVNENKFIYGQFLEQ
ncbi:hypothetical protein C0J52_20042, partial [Blattella germanica]